MGTSPSLNTAREPTAEPPEIDRTADISHVAAKSKALAVALALYFALSFSLFGRALLGHFVTRHVGIGADPPLMMWFLVWWPHAIANRINPILTHAIWAPLGFNLTWQTSIPLISIVAAPLTQALGPVPTFNILALLGIPITAWCAFILCRYLTGSFYASMLGGYIFAFSPMFLGQVAFGHLHTTWAFAVPLTAYMAARRLANDIKPLRFVIFFTLLLVVQFLFSLEIFATMTMFGSMVLALSLGFISRQLRNRIWALVKCIALSYGLALIIVSPYIYFFFAIGFKRDAIWSITTLSADLFNFLIPTPLNELGRIPLFDSISGRFNSGNLAEAGAYLSWPLPVIGALYARRNWREPLGKLFIYSLLIIVVCSLGPSLVINGTGLRRGRVTLPWALAQVPLLNNAAPGRFLMYAYLIFAVITSLWLSSRTMKLRIRIIAAIFVVICMLPNLSAGAWIHSVDSPSFFHDGLYRYYLSKDETVLVLPFADRGDVTFWQAQAHMYFRISEGPGPAVGDYRFWPIVESFWRHTYMPGAAQQFKAFLVNHEVTAVIATDDEFEVWQNLLSTLGVEPVKVGGVHVYKLPSSLQVQNGRNTLVEMRTRFDTERFNTIVIKAEKFAASGGSLRDLTARKACQLNVIPVDSLVGPQKPPTWVRDPELNWYTRDPNYDNGILIFPSANDTVVIGEHAWYPAVKVLMEKYRGTPTEMAFVVHEAAGATKMSTQGVLAMEFNRDQLARAAAVARDSQMAYLGPPATLHAAPAALGLTVKRSLMP